MSFTPGPSSAPPPSGEVDMGALWAALKRRKWWILLPTIAATGAAALVVNMLTPRFTSEARILLESRESFFTRPTADREGGTQVPATFDAEGVQSQVQVITSFDLSRQAIRKLGLVGNPEFDPAEQGLGPLQRILVLAGLQKGPAERTPENRVLENYYERLTVFPVGKSRVVAIEFSSRDAELSAKAANAIAELYLETVRGAKKDTARTAGSFLTAAIEPLRNRVAEAESKAEAFRANVGLIVSTNNATIVQQQLAEGSTQLSAARDAKAQAESKAKLIRQMLRSGRVFEISDVVNNELIRRLIEQRGTLKAQVARDLRTLLPEHPQVRAQQAQIDDVERQIRAAAERQVLAIENDARVAAARVDTLVAALDEQKKNAARASGDEVQLRALEREARTLREQLESYLVKQREAIAREAENAAPADARIISSAIVPTRPTFPKKLPIIVIAGLCMFGISGALVLARELLTAPAPIDPPLPLAPMEMPPVPDEALPLVSAKEAPTAPEAEPRPALPTQSPARPGDAGAPKADGPNASVLSAIAARVAGDRQSGVAVRLLLVAHGAEAAEVATGLARGMSENLRAVLVSLSPTRDDAADAPAGIVELAAGRASFMEAIVREETGRLHRIGRGKGDLDVLRGSGTAFESILDALAETYDAVIVDCPADIDDAIAGLVSRSTDNTILVAPGETPDSSVGANFLRFERLGGREAFVLMLGGEAATREAA